MLLNVQTEYSFLQSGMNVPAYVARAKELGYSSIGIADHNSLHGVHEFVTACKKHQVKPLIGMRLSCKGAIRSDMTFSYLVYAKNYQGYKDLIQLSKFVLIKERTLFEILDFLSASPRFLIWIDLGKKSEASYLWLHQEQDQAQKILLEIQKVMSHDMYIGINLIPQNVIEVESLRKFALDTHLKMVIVSQVNMLNKEDQEMLQVLRAIDSKETLTIEEIQETGQTYLRDIVSFKEMHDFDDSLKLVEHTQELVDKIQIDYPKSQQFLPKYHTPNNQSADDYLSDKAHQGLKALNVDDNIHYIERLSHELAVIQEMGFSDYFLIIADILDFCHISGIQTGPGRGSAPGSLVSYLLDITKIDPIKYNLLFERFLNPERFNMPDIDVDVPDNDRHRVLNYIKNKYGEDYTSQILTFGTFGAKQALRDVLKVFGMDNSEISLWTKYIASQQNVPLSIQESLNHSSRLRGLVERTPHGKKYLDIAMKIEGIKRHSSTHAGAVVISDFPIETMVPVMLKEDQLQVTQFSMYEVEAIGLLKMDFLGLRNLSVLSDVLRGIQRYYHKKIDPFDIRLDDPKVFNIFKKAETQGVFQFESEGIKRVLRKLQPENFEDIVAVNALFRPGPMQQIDLFIQRKHGKEEIEYIDESLKPILKNTYGIIVYQEQVMQIVQQIAGFSLGQADILRRAMGKKDRALMHQQKDKFIQGAINNGYSEGIAQKLFHYIEEFSKYGFNRAHAVVYSYLAYQLAYLKVYYPTIFYSVILNHLGPKYQSFQLTLLEAKKVLGPLLPVDINLSLMDFSIDQDSIRVGLSSISGMRTEFIKAILEQRSLAGPYRNLMDFLRRIPSKFLKSDFIIPLINVGAFDEIDLNRATLANNLQVLIQSVEFSGNDLSLFEALVPKIEQHPDYPEEKKRSDEMEILGFSMKANPLEAMQNYYQENHPQIITNFTNLSGIPLKKSVSLLGIIENLRVIRTKRNALMAFISFSDGLEQTDIVVFPNVFDKCHAFLKEQQLLVIQGTIDLSQKKERQIIAKNINQAQQDKVKTSNKIPTCYVQVNDFQLDKEKIDWLKKYCQNNPGPSAIILVDRDKQTFILESSYNIAFNYRVQRELANYFGAHQVVFQ